MRIIDQYRRDFLPEIRDRGQRYFQAGRVRLLRESAGRSVRAQVRGHDLYRVSLDIQGREIEFRCDCPYSADRGLCKHMWATLLAAEARGLLEPAPNGPPAPDADAPAARSRPRRQGWQRMLDGIGTAIRDRLRAQAELHAPWPGDRRILYLLNVEASIEERYGVVVQIRTRDETSRRLRVLGLTPWDVGRVPDPADRQILGRLVGTRSARNQDFADAPAAEDSFVLPASVAPGLIAEMCATGRCAALAGQARDAPGPFLRFDPGEPWRLELLVEPSPEPEILTVTPALRRGEQTISAAQGVALPGGLLLLEDAVARLADPLWVDVIDLLSRQRAMHLAAAQTPQFLKQVYDLPAPPALRLPEGMAPRELRVAPTPRLALRPDTGPTGKPRLEAALSFAYGEARVLANDGGGAILTPDLAQVIVRDREREAALFSRLLGAGVRQRHNPDTGHTLLTLRPSLLSSLVMALTAEGWIVEAEGRIHRRAGLFKASVRSGIDWFDIDGVADFDGQTVALPKLLEAIRRRQTTIRLDDGSIGVLPEEWLNRYAPLLTGESVDGALRFTRAQIGLLDALLTTLPQVDVDAAFEQARRALQETQRIDPVDAPPEFVGELRPYQREGLGWLRFLDRAALGGCLADDMGLGKTVQVLALLAAGGAAAPSLVVVPRSLVFNWKAEATRFAPGLRVLDHTGPGRARDPRRLLDCDVVVTTYGTLRRDVDLLRQIRFRYVILDEAQAIKNADTDSAKAARLLQGERRLALSGTPVENHLGELWSLFEFLNPGLLGRQGAAHALGSASLDASTRGVLARALRPFILRRTKQQVATDLPEKQEQTLVCELGPRQRALYDELRDHYRISLQETIAREGFGASRMHVLEALLRLRQAACHPALIDERHADAGSAKFDALVPTLLETVEEGHKALVFSQFTRFLGLLRRELDARGATYEYLDGKTRDRAARVARFQSDPACRLFLISLKAGGLGLNLTAADYVFLLDPWWNPAVETQAIDRAHRIGQTRHVFAYRLIARDTVEEKVLDLQRTKKDLADAIITADNSVLRALTPDDLALLLG